MSQCIITHTSHNVARAFQHIHPVTDDKDKIQEELSIDLLTVILMKYRNYQHKSEKNGKLYFVL
jgi:hypothetical protein